MGMQSAAGTCPRFRMCLRALTLATFQWRADLVLQRSFNQVGRTHCPSLSSATARAATTNSRRVLRDTLHRTVTITMKIKRLLNGDCTASGCPPVRLQRAFEGDVDNNTVANAAFGRSVDSVWEWIDPGSSDSNLTTGHGLHLSNVANGGATPITTVYSVSDYGAYADQACIVFSGQVTTPTNPAVTDATTLVGRLMYFFGNIPLNHSQTVKVVYERF